MQSKRPLILLLTAFTVVLGFLTIAAPAFAASNEKVLHNFCSRHRCADGSKPYYSTLIFDSAGNLYGTTLQGGDSGYGTVFQLVPNADGTWTEAVLYSFAGNTFGTGDGASPFGGLIFDATGNLYGTTAGGGAYSYGTVFELAPNAGGAWTETVLYSFTGGNDSGPTDSLIFDGAGNLYGTTTGLSPGNACDSDYNCGTVFELTPNMDGTWTETVLHKFISDGKDGWWPYAGVILDSAGNLYGTTFYGGAHDVGTVFQLSPSAGGAWTEKILPVNPAHPIGGLTLDGAGDLYGTGAGYGSGGIAFELIPGSNGKWKGKTLYTFTYDGQPQANLIFDAAGHLYGTTTQGGGTHYYGSVFRLAHGTKGKWTEKTLHSFNRNGKDGYYPYSSLVFDGAGNLYGTTELGGDHNGRSPGGTVYEITP
jgi:uncharacterized repeat protein (TIGR03803 family)